jgi:hypothetical protein
VNSDQGDGVRENELALKLLPLLEAIANLHYLLDHNISRPDKLEKLRAMENETFNSVLTLVQSYLPKPNRLSR